ncbi:MAG: class I SAM-dependent methyltransferase [Ignavibacteriaceae bacterium]|jgi:FkbM family methyltransferase
MDSKILQKIPVDYTFNSEIKEQLLVRRLVKPGMTVFDLGAHLGKYTKLFSLLTENEGKVYAFEPTPESFNELEKETTVLNLKNVFLINKAVYSENSTLKFNQFPQKYSSWNGLGNPIMENPEDHQKFVPHVKSIEVEAVAIDKFCEESGIIKIDYVKLDVEGAEIFALFGMKELLLRKAIKYLQFEISKNMLDGLHSKADYVFEFLNKLDYDCFEILDNGTLGNIVTGSNSFYENYLAIPREQKSIDELLESPTTTLQNEKTFTDNGYWTPQTMMLRSINDIVQSIEGVAVNALSIDVNPTLNEILLSRWTNLDIKVAKYPEIDAQNLSSFKDETFDVVFSHQVLEHIPKPWIAAKEMNRVLKCGGVGIHTSCAYNPRHGYPAFKDYYRFLPDGLAELFDDVNIWVKDGWGSKEAILYNLAIDDGFGQLGGRRFVETLGKKNDENFPWVTWVIFQKKK